MRARAVVVAGLLGLVFLACTGCPPAKGGDGGGGGFQMPPAVVTDAAVVATTVPVFIDAIGRCAAYEIVSVQPRVTGTIVKIHFKEGDEVKKDDPLLTIDPRPYQAQLDLAEGTVAQNKAQLELSQLEFERMQTLLKTNAVSRQEFDAKKSAVDVARAVVAQGEAAVVAARLNVEFCSIVSPIDGRAGQKLVDVGNMVIPSPTATTTLLVIQRQDPIYADFTISERDLPAVRRAIAAKTLEARVHAPGDPAPARTAPVTFLDNAVQDGTGTVKLRALIKNEDRSFWPGQFMDVRLVLAERSSLVVPASAIQIGQNGPYVYLIKGDSTAEIRPVNPGQRHGSLVAIESGLQPGERVVVTGQLMVFPGGKVQVTPPAGAPPPGTESPHGASK